MHGMYILIGTIPVPADNLLEWAEYMENPNRIVARDEFGDVLVSTVFLGLDHRFGQGDPILFETMIFSGRANEYQERYCTWSEAIKGHKAACDLVKMAALIAPEPKKKRKKTDKKPTNNEQSTP